MAALEQAQQRLKVAAEVGDIDGLYQSIKQAPNILDRVDENPFVDSPLHVAASAGNAEFALEIIQLKRSFGQKLNLDGFSPLHLALQNGNSKTVRKLIKFDSELVRVKGREGLTTLHYAAQMDNIELLAEFLSVCPASIKDLTIRDETALHVAVKHSSFSALKILSGWLHKTDNAWVLNCKDSEGNTVLHFAVSTSQTKIVRLLIKEFPHIINEKSSEGLTALDIALIPSSNRQDEINKQDIRNILLQSGALDTSSLPDDLNLVDYLLWPEHFWELIFKYTLRVRKNLSMEARNVVLVVAVLIATATFQAVLSPPGGFENTDSSQTSSPPASEDSFRALIKPSEPKTPNGSRIPYDAFFYVFYVPNTLAFVASIISIVVVLQWRPYTALLHISLAFLMISYGVSFVFISPSFWHALISILLLCVLAFLGYGIKVVYSILERQIDLQMYQKTLWLSQRLMQRLQMQHYLLNQ
ncbi:hypothetical protein NMG60_11030246 [Bertholletia excelsa]